MKISKAQADEGRPRSTTSSTPKIPPSFSVSTPSFRPTPVASSSVSKLNTPNLDLESHRNLPLPEPVLRLRSVANCLCCGRIYDLRKVLNSAEIGGWPAAIAAAGKFSNPLKAFLESEGTCTYCGIPINVYARGSPASAAFTSNTAAAATKTLFPSSFSSGSNLDGSLSPSDAPLLDELVKMVELDAAKATAAADAAAVALKDRLVNYDRNSAKRTAVVDDQSDFFEIETNLWLTDKEREEIKRRKQIEAEAEEACRRRQITVSFDFMGRRVIVAENDSRRSLAAPPQSPQVDFDSEGEEAAGEGARGIGDYGARSAKDRTTSTADASYESASYGSVHQTVGSHTIKDGVDMSDVFAGMDEENGGISNTVGVNSSNNSSNNSGSTCIINPSTTDNAYNYNDNTKNSADDVEQILDRLRQMKMTKDPSTKTTTAAAAINAAAAVASDCLIQPVVSEADKTVACTAAKGFSNGTLAARKNEGSRLEGRIQMMKEGISANSAVKYNQNSSARKQKDRLQYSFMDEFDELNRNVLLAMEDRERKSRSKIQAPYDICPAVRVAPSASSASTPPLMASPPASLPPGVVVLKRFLPLAEQISVVQRVRELGLGPGGFYQPTYLNSYGSSSTTSYNRSGGGGGGEGLGGREGGGQMHLQMMGLGWHWDPRENTYTQCRANYDEAEPPPLPPWIDPMTQRAWRQASFMIRAKGGSVNNIRNSNGTNDPLDKESLPPIRPDVCLVNFYEPITGTLGLHQDKDESKGVLRRGIPVVSFSIGDAADFSMAKTRESPATTVRLESGDALIFGGPSRMIFHAITRVYPNTAPSELIEATGMRPGRLNLTVRQHVLIETEKDEQAK